MKKILNITLLGLLIGTTLLSADSTKGKKIYLKKFKAPCGINGVVFSQIHTQDGWKTIKEDGRLGIEIRTICPKLKLKDVWINDIYDFAYEYASDSGNIPNC